MKGTLTSDKLNKKEKMRTQRNKHCKFREISLWIWLLMQKKIIQKYLFSWTKINFLREKKSSIFTTFDLRLNFHKLMCRVWKSWRMVGNSYFKKQDLLKTVIEIEFPRSEPFGDSTISFWLLLEKSLVSIALWSRVYFVLWLLINIKLPNSKKGTQSID